MGAHYPDSVPPPHYTPYYASMSRIYVQPAFLIKYPAIEVISSVRWSGVHYGFRHGTSLEDFGVTSIKTYSFVEAAMTLRFTPPRLGWLGIGIQCGAAIPSAGISFFYHSYIGNAGLWVDPVGFFRWARRGKRHGGGPR